MQAASAVNQMLGDEEGEAEQMVAVLDARQATTLQVTRKVNLIKRLALALNQVHSQAPLTGTQLVFVVLKVPSLAGIEHQKTLQKLCMRL